MLERLRKASGKRKRICHIRVSGLRRLHGRSDQTITKAAPDVEAVVVFTPRNEVDRLSLQGALTAVAIEFAIVKLFFNSPLRSDAEHDHSES